ncbi:hypothetical protein F5Y07DRAFT_405328 [Xylaria sp. FL0933]|nr:hypothetical protein F5Y07DRAFT_405328 [Xylaria sp. FL0933]
MPADIEYDRHQTIATLLSGKTIARRFAEAAATQLGQHELALLVEFFDNRDRPAAETSLSNQDRTRLTIASGRENSDLGLILLVASHDRQHVAFWDPESPTIQLLHGKGLDDEALLGYDWHWRAECSDDRRKPQCMTTRWSKELKRFHDEFSADVAKILPLPFLIVAGVCPANSYTKFLDKPAKFVEVIISPPDGKIKICLEFDTEGQCLKRITLIIDHPAAIFYAKPALIRKITMRLDTGLNMILWLLGKKYTIDYFLRKGSICHYTRWTPNGFEHGLKGVCCISTRKGRLESTGMG